MIAMSAIFVGLDSIGLMESHTPLTRVFVVLTVLSMVITAIAWVVWIISEILTDQAARPKTAYKQELHEQTQKNRDMLKMAGIIILSIIVAFFLLVFILTYIVHIELIFTLTPTTTP
jgi:uncharacterized membrane protein